MNLETLRADARACFAAALAAVDPERAVACALARDGDALVLRGADGEALARHAGPVLLVGAGKAVVSMASAARTVAGASLRDGVVIAPHGRVARDLAPIGIRRAAHPVPDAAGVAATDEIVRLVEGARDDTLVVVLLSGGASALLAAPAAGISLADVQVLTAALLAAGADIAALNAIRKHCSRVTGGGLARAAAGARGCWTLVLSDVVGDDLATIGSGPTVADPTTFADALAHLAALGVTPPPAVAAHLAAGAAGSVAETVKPGDPVVERVCVRLVAGNGDAVAGAADEARRRGYAVTRWREALRGDAAAAGRALGRALLASSEPGRHAVVAGGETTVRAVSGGLGGRAQHLALAAADALAGAPAVLLAGGTDGVDGPTTAAGGCVDGETATRLRTCGIDLARALAATDSHRALAAAGDLVVTGPTGTNVADVVVALREAK